MWTFGQRLGTPILQQGEFPSCPGAGIYAAVQVDPLQPVRLQGLVNNSFIVVAHHAQVGVLRKNLSTEHGETPHWDQSGTDIEADTEAG